MINRVQRQSALLVLLKAWRSYGTAAFAVDPHGAHWDALRDAERLGWCSFVGRRCRVADEGIRELAPWRQQHAEAAE